jgi:hypothetical protein
LLAAVFVCELQPFLIDGMFKIADTHTAGSPFWGLTASWINRLAVIAAPIAAVAAFFRQQLGDIVSKASAGLRPLLAKLFAHAAIWIAGLALPLLIWVGYLYLCFWGVKNTGSTYSHAPTWLRSLANLVDALMPSPQASPIAGLYLIAGVSLGIVALLLRLRPNANSLHRLYRDRIGKAFLFDPNQPATKTRITQDRDFKPLDRMPLTELSTTLAPYHLINATLNVQGSDFANRRGRNADFFLFSREFVGSYATGYAKTEILEKTEKSLDLATAIAISGAAVSSNMGGVSIRPLRPMLTLLNIRLGYWLKNPRYARPDGQPREPPTHRLRSYLWSEITGRLYEDSDVVYVTDGGHVEKLGVYELLRRRCRLIVVVDAEADAEMRFPSFMRLQRYARIDLGVRIDLPVGGCPGGYSGVDGLRLWRGQIRSRRDPRPPHRDRHDRLWSQGVRLHRLCQGFAHRRRERLRARLCAPERLLPARDDGESVLQ